MDSLELSPAPLEEVDQPAAGELAPRRGSVTGRRQRASTATATVVCIAETSARADATVEAVVANGSGRLKPGFFATARIERSEQTSRIVVPATAIRTVTGTARLFVVDGERARERVVTVGETADGAIEVRSGLSAGERVATSAVNSLVDGGRIVVR